MSSIESSEQHLHLRDKALKQFTKILDYVDESYEQRKAAHEVELGIFRRILELGFSLLEMFFRKYGTGDLGDQLTLPDGKVVKRLKEQRKKEYLSIFGQHDILRTVYGTGEKKKIQWVPVDAELQLPEVKFSYVLQDWSQDIAGDVPFNPVNDVLGKILNLNQSVNSLERTNRKMSESAESFWDQKEPPSAEEEGEIQVFQCDGKGVVIRPEDNEESTQNDPATQEKKEGKERNGKKKMALVGASYTIDPYIRTPEEILESLFRSKEKKEERTPRPKPVAKHVRASLLRDVRGTMLPSYDEIFGWQANELNIRNPELTKNVVFLMDGQDSLWQAIPRYFPVSELNLTLILDIIHVTSYLWDATDLFYDKGSSDATGFAKNQIRRILNGEVTSVIRGLRWRGTHQDLSESKIEKLEKICGYLENNRHRMAYDEYLAAGYPIASGVIEGACRNIVVDRMEHSGMRWVMEGADAMLEIRCIKLSGLWDEFNEFRIHRESERLYPGYAANDEYISKAA